MRDSPEIVTFNLIYQRCPSAKQSEYEGSRLVGRLLITDGEENWLDTRRVERRLIVKIDLSLSSDSSLISLSLATNSLHLRPRRGRILFTSKLDIAPLASLLSALSVPSNSRTCMQLQQNNIYLVAPHKIIINIKTISHDVWLTFILLIVYISII